MTRVERRVTAGRARRNSRRRPGLEAMESRCLLATYLVTTAADSGAGSFRDAIEQANQNSGADRIEFAIGSGLRTITPQTPLPNITDAVVIDATTQPGPTGTPRIELNGSAAGDFANGLSVTSGVATIRGLVINRFALSGVAISGGAGHAIEGNFLGTDPTGTFGLGNGLHGIQASNARSIRIGGSTAGVRNVISGNGVNGIFIGEGTVGNTIQGNRIGTDQAGLLPVSNGGDGIGLRNSQNNTIGGPVSGQGNVIGGNAGYGIRDEAFGAIAGSNRILGNAIGTDFAGLANLGNGSGGLVFTSSNNTIGGLNPGEGNRISFNNGPGVQVSGVFAGNTPRGNAILSNSIFRNTGLGIDLNAPGVSGNDARDFDAGGNDGQNFPVVSSAFNTPAGTVVQGVLRSTPNRDFTIQLFDNPVPDPSGFGEGLALVGEVNVTTDSDGVVYFETTLAGVALEVGRFVTATATGRDNNTSEFSEAARVFPGPAADLVVTPPFLPTNVTVGSTVFLGTSVANSGPSAAEDVAFTVELPAGVTVVDGTSDRGTLRIAGGVATLTVDRLESGESASIRLEIIPGAVGPLEIRASATGATPDPTPANDSNVATAAVLPTVSDLILAVRPRPVPVLVGDRLAYEIFVGNFGPDSSGSTTVTQTLPEGVRFVSATGGQGDPVLSGRTLTLDVGRLERFGTRTLQVVVVPEEAGLLSSEFTVQGPATSRDPDTTDNRRVVEVEAQAIRTDLAVGLAARPGVVLAGEELTYVATVTNFGPQEARDVVLTDWLPAGVRFVSARATQGTAVQSGGVVTANLGRLAPGATATVTIVVVPGTTGRLSNTVTVRGAAEAVDANPNNDEATVETPVVADQAPPRVEDRRFVVRGRQIEAIAIRFNEALDPEQVRDLINYSLRTAGRDRLFGTADDVTVPLASVSYDAGSFTARLTTGRPLQLGELYNLAINPPGAPGLVDLAGNLLDGDGNGIADGAYSTFLGRGTHLRPDNNPAVTRLPRFRGGAAFRPSGRPAARPGGLIESEVTYTRRTVRREG